MGMQKANLMKQQTIRASTLADPNQFDPIEDVQVNLTPSLRMINGPSVSSLAFDAESNKH